MSNVALAHVWKHSKQTGSHLLVLVAIADAANDDGECYPGVSRLADKCNMQDRNLQRIIRDLEASGELAVDYFQGTDTRRGWTNRYRIVFDIKEGVQGSAPVEVSEIEQGVQEVAPVGVQGSAPRSLSIEPSEELKQDDDDDAGARARADRLEVEIIMPRTMTVQHAEELIAAIDAIPAIETTPEPDSNEFNIFALYHTTFARMVSNPILADDLKDMAATYPHDWIQDAFKQAALANATSHKYALTCLQRWQKEGRTPKPNVRIVPSQEKKQAHSTPPVNTSKPKRAEYPADEPDMQTMFYYRSLGMENLKPEQRAAVTRFFGT